MWWNRNKAYYSPNGDLLAAHTYADGSTVMVKIERIISSDQPSSKIGAFFECAATFYGVEKRFKLYYSSMSRRWSLQRIAG